jgi:hypothetical protein
MRHPRDQIVRRILSQSSITFVMQLDGNIVGSIATQRISAIADLENVTWVSEDEVCHPLGRILQLLRVNTLLLTAPHGCAGLAVGAILRDFCIEYANALGIEEVCAVTKTTDFILQQEDTDYFKYIERGLIEDGGHTDKGLNFHLSSGATVLKIMPSWRPEDADNKGHGVLILYDVKSVLLEPVILFSFCTILLFLTPSCLVSLHQHFFLISHAYDYPNILCYSELSHFVDNARRYQCYWRNNC